MEKYIPEIYNTLVDKLKPIIEQYKLDTITVESLIRSSVEVEDLEVQPVTTIWKNKEGKVYSTKASNIKVDLKFALSSVLRVKTIIEKKDIWLVLAIIHLIVDLFTMATQEVDEFSSVVLVAVYRLQHCNLERISDYINEICLEDMKCMFSSEKIEESLEKLESWGCITCKEGKFEVNETVAASMIKEISSL